MNTNPLLKVPQVTSLTSTYYFLNSTGAEEVDELLRSIDWISVAWNMQNAMGDKLGIALTCGKSLILLCTLGHCLMMFHIVVSLRNITYLIYCNQICIFVVIYYIYSETKESQYIYCFSSSIGVWMHQQYLRVRHRGQSLHAQRN